MGKISKAVSTALSASLWLVVVGVIGLNALFSFDRYFDLGKVLIPDDVAQDGFEFTATGRALVDFTGSYRVFLRDFSTNEVTRQYPDSGAFGYQPKTLDSGEVVSHYPNPVSFDWWVGLPGRLDPLPIGLFYVETCWTVHNRLGGLFPPVTECVDSNPFRVE